MKMRRIEAGRWVRNRYMPEGQVDLYKIGADTLPLVRAGAGQYFKHHIRNTPKTERTRAHAVAYLAVAATDMADGWLVRRSISGPDWLGGKLDNYSDKALNLPITHALAETGEISEYHWQVARARDIGVSGVREVASFYGIEGFARDLGKYKFWIQTAACASALMPEDVCSRDFTEKLFVASSALTVASGVDQIQSLAREAFALIGTNEQLSEVLRPHTPEEMFEAQVNA